MRLRVMRTTHKRKNSCAAMCIWVNEWKLLNYLVKYAALAKCKTMGTWSEFHSFIKATTLAFKPGNSSTLFSISRILILAVNYMWLWKSCAINLFLVIKVNPCFVLALAPSSLILVKFVVAKFQTRVRISTFTLYPKCAFSISRYPYEDKIKLCIAIIDYRLTYTNAWIR